MDKEKTKDWIVNSKNESSTSFLIQHMDLAKVADYEFLLAYFAHNRIYISFMRMEETSLAHIFLINFSGSDDEYLFDIEKQIWLDDRPAQICAFRVAEKTYYSKKYREDDEK